MSGSDDLLPPVTFIVEWGNAIVVDDRWAKKAILAFQDELERCSNRFARKPGIMYLFDENAVRESTIRDVIDQVAPKLAKLADLELVATPGLTYYKLKNHGVSRAETDLVVMLDSDVSPQPGWLEGLLSPFADKEVMAVGGVTLAGWEDLWSKTMALSWFFNLSSEREKTVKRRKIHVNNCAFRTAFFRKNPFPELKGSFKKSCSFWLRDIDRRGVSWVRTADAIAVHAPFPGGSFTIWRAWTTGKDRDLEIYYTVTKSRLGRLGHALYYWLRKLVRSWSRIWTKGVQVDLPIWQRPIAMLYSLCFFTAMLFGELYSAISRSFD